MGVVVCGFFVNKIKWLNPPFQLKFLLSSPKPRDCRGTGTRRTQLSNFPLTSAISSWRKPWILLLFLGCTSDAVTLGETLAGTFMARQLRAKALPSTLLHQRGGLQTPVPLAPRSHRERGDTQRSRLHLPAAKHCCWWNDTGITPPAMHHLGTGKGGTGSKIPSLCLLMRGLPWTST